MTSLQNKNMRALLATQREMAQEILEHSRRAVHFAEEFERLAPGRHPGVKLSAKVMQFTSWSLLQELDLAIQEEINEQPQ